MMSLLVFPEKLQLRHREQVRASPDLDEEELSEIENSPDVPEDVDLLRLLVSLGRRLDILDSFVECVGGMMPALRSNPLKQYIFINIIDLNRTAPLSPLYCCSMLIGFFLCN